MKNYFASTPKVKPASDLQLYRENTEWMDIQYNHNTKTQQKDQKCGDYIRQMTRCLQMNGKKKTEGKD